jgi:predicted nuclease with RNAse H fold
MTAIGIDVGGYKKGFHGCAVRGLTVVDGPTHLDDVRAAVAWVKNFDATMVAIDCPCSCAPKGKSSREGERELAKCVCGIRWTPDRSKLKGNKYYEWIEHGLKLYAALTAAGVPKQNQIEVFPTAAWTVWAGKRGKVSRAKWSAKALDDLHLAGITKKRLSQDDRDAIAAALVAQMHEHGETDAYGEIKVPGRAPGSAPRVG